MACVLTPSTLLRLQVALQGTGPELHALLRPKPLMFSGTPQRSRLCWACVLCLPCSEQLRKLGAWWAHSPQVQHNFSPPWPHLSFPGARVQFALCLFWAADLWLRPSRHLSTIQNLWKSLVRNWKPVCSLEEDALSGAEFAPFWLWLGPASPLLPVGDGPFHSRLTLLWYCSVLCLRLGIFTD